MQRMAGAWAWGGGAAAAALALGCNLPATFQNGGADGAAGSDASGTDANGDAGPGTDAANDAGGACGESALVFANVEDDRVTVPWSASFDLFTTLTVEAWVQPGP